MSYQIIDRIEWKVTWRLASTAPTGVAPRQYTNEYSLDIADHTDPFVDAVWRKSAELDDAKFRGTEQPLMGLT